VTWLPVLQDLVGGKAGVCEAQAASVTHGNNLPAYFWPPLPCPVCAELGECTSGWGGSWQLSNGRKRKEEEAFRFQGGSGLWREERLLGKGGGRRRCPVRCHLKAGGLVSAWRHSTKPQNFPSASTSAFYNPTPFHRPDIFQSYFPLKPPKVTPRPSFIALNQF